MIRLWIYIVLALVLLLIVFIVSRVIKKIMEKKLLEAKQRVETLSESEEGRVQLETESKSQEEKIERRLPLIMVVTVLSYALILIAGLVGLIGLVSGIIRGEKISRLIGGGNGLYVLSPLIVLVSAARLIKIFRDR